MFFLTIVSAFFSFSGFSETVGIDRARIAGREFFSRNCSMYHLPAHENASIISEFTVGEAKSPDYYVFNFSGTGFVIVSADDAVYPVLGYSYESAYSRENLSPEFSFWMEQYVNQIRHVRENHLPADATISRAWAGLLGMESREEKDGSNDPSKISPQIFSDKTPTEVQPLIGDIWHQYLPYNALCPADTGCWGGHVLVGCVATAMSMIMHYWRYPETGQGSHCDNAAPVYGSLCADFGATTYDWNGMKQSLNVESDPVAILCYHTGISLDMVYGPNISWAFTSNVAPALVNYFGYSPSAQYLNRYEYSTSDWVSLLKANLDASKPIEYNGDGPSGGHAWVCDGYQGDNYFHMNWGWGGTFNGYFYLHNLNPGTYTFTGNQSATINIQPDVASYPTYCAGADTVSTSYGGSIEDGSGPKADYPPGSDCSWLITATDGDKNITLTFLRFATNSDDFVKIYDGSATSDPLLAQYSGSTLPDSVTSTGPIMLVTFSSGSGRGAQGFLAEYTSDYIDFCNGTTILTEAAGNFTDGSGIFQYHDATNCKWRINPPGATRVTLIFNSFDTEAGNDKVSVYDDLTGDLLGQYSGKYTILPPPVTSTSGQMLVMFTTNQTIRGQGWEASYSSNVGTPENDIRHQITLFPNPATDVLHVSIPASVNSLQSHIDILDLSSNILLSHSLHDVTTDLDVSRLSPGMYFLKVNTSEGNCMRKFVVSAR